MSSPQVSVIVPIYNAERYLSRCLDSLVNQTLKDIEIICIDDGSSDSTIDILKEYRRHDKRIKLIQIDNSGQSKARNFGLLQANGDYLAFVDSDDYINLEMLEKMYGAAVENNADCVVCGLKVEYENAQDYTQGTISWGKAKHEGTSEICPDILKNLRTNVLDKMFRRRIITDNNILFPSGINLNEDGVFVWSSLPFCKVISFIKEDLYHYIQHEDSTIYNICSGSDPRVCEFPVSWRIIIDRLAHSRSVPKLYAPLLDVIIGNISYFTPYVPDELRIQWDNDIKEFFTHFNSKYPTLLKRFLQNRPGTKRLLTYFIKNETLPYSIREKIKLAKYKILSGITIGRRKKHYLGKYDRLRFDPIP